MTPDQETVREARARYFAENALGDGGYDDRFVVIRARGIPIGAFPNTAGRVRAVRLHDVHHIATGYGTSLVGEGEIGAWELGSGCRGYLAAWVLNGLAAAFALLLAPRRVVRAFQRGRRSRNLYEGEWDERILELRVGDLRQRLGIPAA